MSFAYMPLFTGDYLRDTQHLSCSEHGIYLKFLMHCWDQKAQLPADERKLASICNARSGDEIEAMRRVLSEFFISMDDGHYNKRMSEEIAKSERLSKALSEAGLKSAETRRSKARQGARTKVKQEINQGLTQVEPRSVSLSPSLTPTSTPKELPPLPPLPGGAVENPISVPARKKPKTDFAIELPPWLEKTDWDKLVKHREELKLPFTELGASETIEKLRNLRAQGSPPDRVIQDAIIGHSRYLQAVRLTDEEKSRLEEEKMWKNAL